MAMRQAKVLPSLIISAVMTKMLSGRSQGHFTKTNNMATVSFSLSFGQLFMNFILEFIETKNN